MRGKNFDLDNLNGNFREMITFANRAIPENFVVH